MPFAAFCKKCKKEEDWAKHDNKSYAYMLGSKLTDIKVEISKHFKSVHNIAPNPTPESLSWNKDFKKVEFELWQYGIGDRDVSHLTFFFQGPSVRQFDCDDYTISVITHYHYNRCVEAIKNKRRFDYALYEYFL
jgi:hypothetical protein